MGRSRIAGSKHRGPGRMYLSVKQPPLRLRVFKKREIRTQFAALCYRFHKDQVQVLLITSRTSRRWILPKGWPLEGEKPADAAMTEAFEEAGVKGKPIDFCIGMYSYMKVMSKKLSLPCAVSVFPVRVKKLVDDFPEAGQRKRKWVTPKKAAKLVREPELQKILLHFDPAMLER
ncbi:MAG: NUDIX hydrolase [Pseudomonadota bacterium]